MALCLAICLLGVSAAEAALEGRVTGFVRERSGRPIAGVEVTVASDHLQGERATRTDAAGFYSIPSLPAGDGYRLLFALAGYRPIESRGVAVPLSGEARVDAVLDPSAAPVEATVVVSAAEDSARVGYARNLPETSLRRLPVGREARSYRSVLEYVPGTGGPAGSSALGSYDIETSWLVDGIDSSDPVTHTALIELPFDALEEANVQLAGYDAEYGRASGAVVNLVTRSGGNRLSGSFDLRFASDGLAESGDHYDPSAAPFESLPASATLGGPLAVDRLWAFGAIALVFDDRTPPVPNETIRAQNPAPPPYRGRGWNGSAKLTATVSPRLSGFVSALFGDTTIEGEGYSALFRPEAARTYTSRTRHYSLKVDAVPSATSLVGLQAGRSEGLQERRPLQDLSVASWRNVAEGDVLYDNYDHIRSGDRSRNQVGLSAWRLLEGASGRHELKAGGDLERLSYTLFDVYTGTPTDPSFCPAGLQCGVRFWFQGFDAAGRRRPYLQIISENVPERRRGGRSYALYARDEWRPTGRLTLNAGARWDRAEYENNEGREVVALSKAQPRVGLAFDLSGRGTTVLRAAYGWFAVEAPLALTELFDTGVSSPILRGYAFAQGRWNYLGQLGGAPATEPRIDRPLSRTYDEHLTASVDHVLAPGITASLTGVYKETHDIFQQTCTVNPGCPDQWLSNQPGRDLGLRDLLRKSYRGLLAEVRLRLPAPDLTVDASYTLSRSRGSVYSPDGFYAGEDFVFYPDNHVNRDGYLPHDARHRVKVFSSLRLASLDAGVAVSYVYRSGLPYDVTMPSPDGKGTVFVEPRGHSRTPALHALDASLEKTFRLVCRLRLTLLGSVRNALDQERATAVFGGASSPSTFRRPSAYQPPRRYELGIRIEY